MEDIAKRKKYDKDAAKKAVAMLDLGERFVLDFEVYKRFVENFIEHLDSGSKISVRRTFNTSGNVMNRKIKSYLREAIKSMGYREIKRDVFDRSLEKFQKSWEEVLKKKKKSTVNASGNYTKPAMRKRIFNRIKAGSKGGAAGQWSARKAQMLAQAYKKAGGGYKN
tara:strand:- start:1126 stop:1623 length:498 start_codon:yes stop_codon:yes gene_type:complete